jgi:hypothetical protein
MDSPAPPFVGADWRRVRGDASGGGRGLKVEVGSEMSRGASSGSPTHNRSPSRPPRVPAGQGTGRCFCWLLHNIGIAEVRVPSHFSFNSNLFTQIKILEQGTLALSQSTYLDKVLKRFKMEDSKKGFLPIMKGVSLSVTQCPAIEKEKSLMSNIPYASAIGSIMYAKYSTICGISS